MEIVHEFLDKYANFSKDKISSENKQNLLDELNNIHAEIILFTQSIKEFKQDNSEFNIEQIQDVKFEIKTTTEFTEQEIQEMLKIYTLNYQDKSPE